MNWDKQFECKALEASGQIPICLWQQRLQEHKFNSILDKTWLYK